MFEISVLFFPFSSCSSDVTHAGGSCSRRRSHGSQQLPTLLQGCGGWPAMAGAGSRGERRRWQPVRAAALRRGARCRPARPAAQLAAAVGPSGCLQAESGQQAAGPARGPSNPRGAARPRSQRQRPKVWHTHAHLWSRHLWSGVLQLSSFVHETLLFQLQCLMIG